eukprot:scaffold1460_cov73-Cyclotella_meneghiniana.AAC.3
MATQQASHQCAVCDEPASKRCVQCKSIWYCSKEHQVSSGKFMVTKLLNGGFMTQACRLGF